MHVAVCSLPLQYVGHPPRSQYPGIWYSPCIYEQSYMKQVDADHDFILHVFIYSTAINFIIILLFYESSSFLPFNQVVSAIIFPFINQVSVYVRGCTTLLSVHLRGGCEHQYSSNILLYHSIDRNVSHVSDSIYPTIVFRIILL